LHGLVQRHRGHERRPDGGEPQEDAVAPEGESHEAADPRGSGEPER
jgi:hypothetical protein